MDKVQITEAKSERLKKKVTELERRCSELTKNIMELTDRNVELEMEVRKHQMLMEKVEVAHEAIMKHNKFLADQFNTMLDACETNIEQWKQRFKETAGLASDEVDEKGVPPVTARSGELKKIIN